jgi:hypothetical protein
LRFPLGVGFSLFVASFLGVWFPLPPQSTVNPKQRRDLLLQIEGARKSRVVVYVTGDRQGAESRIGMDVFPYFHDVLNKIGETNQIDLLLYSAGGVTMAGWGLVNVIREYCKRFCVLIPFKAHSTATLMALGADEIVMGSMGQLSPVDPSITSPFNPVAPGPQGVSQVLPISVEDVISYMQLAREEAKLEAPEQLLEVFRKLSDTVQPMALGSVYRAKQQIKLLAQKLLSFHMDEKADKAKIDAVVKYVTKELYSHDYVITRREAKQVMKLPVVFADKKLETLLWEAFQLYSDAMDLNTPYNPGIALGLQSQGTVRIESAFIESAENGFVHAVEKDVRKIMPGQIPGLQMAGIGFMEQILSQGWNKIEVNP